MDTDRQKRLLHWLADDMFVLLLIVGLIALVALWLPVGFTGTDDYRYLVAAERWLGEGIHTGANHWANRLPYVLSLVASFSAFGVSMFAFTLVNASFFAVGTYAAWKIGCDAYGAGNAPLIGVLIILLTPLLMRQPTYFYPEVSEVALLTVTAWIVLVRDRWPFQRRLIMLLLAGIIGGLAMLVRQTAVAVPVALAALIFFFTPHERIRDRIRDIAVLAAGFCVPILLELLFYVAMTGDPLHRFKIDSAHVKIANRLRDKASIDTDSVLFNWELASHWERESAIPSHWTITPFVRLFVSAGMLLVPWIGIVGGWLAWKRGGAARRLALLTMLVIGLQYLLNTFVIVLPPNTRYFGIGLVLLALLAGYALAWLPISALRIGALVVLVAAPAFLALAFQPRFAVMNDNLAMLAETADETVYLPGAMLKYSAVQRRADSEFANRVKLGKPPVGAAFAVMGYVAPEMGSERCSDGRPGAISLKTATPNPLMWRAVTTIGLAEIVPKAIARILRKDSMKVSLYRRIC